MLTVIVHNEYLPTGTILSLYGEAYEVVRCNENPYAFINNFNITIQKLRRQYG